MAETHSIRAAAVHHKGRHAADGPDPIRPEDIGAAEALHVHSWGQVTGKPVNFPPAGHTHTWAQVTGKPSTFAPSAHAASHASGGTDAITPASIGAVSGVAAQAVDVDVDTLVQPGRYFVALTTPNSPGQGFVEVINRYDSSTSHSTQLFYSSNGQAVQAIRSRTDGSAPWPAWTRLVTDDDPRLYQSGMRDISSLLTPSVTGYLHVVRSGPVVTLHVASLKSADATTTARTVATLPAGLRPRRPVYFLSYWGQRGYVDASGGIHLGTLIPSTGGGDYVTLTWTAISAPPATPPGTPG